MINTIMASVGTYRSFGSLVKCTNVSIGYKITKLTKSGNNKKSRNFDNKIYKGNVCRIGKDAIEIDIFTRKICIKDYNKITKIPDTKKH